MPVRPVVFALGVLSCLAGAITCATVEADVVTSFPATSDVLILGGLVLTIFGVASRQPRARQRLGPRPKTAGSPSDDAPR